VGHRRLREGEGPAVGMNQSPKLHIGGTQVRPGWKIMNIQPGLGVDFVGDISDLSQFAEESFQEIYASHVLEHVPQAKFVKTLQGIHRILKTGGAFMVSVPDLDTLCSHFIQLAGTDNTEARIYVMRMIFGGQVDRHDFHYIGLSFDILAKFAGTAGFRTMKRVQSFDEFDDMSDHTPFGQPISLNVILYK
jgi:predicted SAM-dependent methyltransferase